MKAQRSVEIQKKSPLYVTRKFINISKLVLTCEINVTPGNFIEKPELSNVEQVHC
jgi:hypothetical protein